MFQRYKTFVKYYCKALLAIIMVLSSSHYLYGMQSTTQVRLQERFSRCIQTMKAERNISQERYNQLARQLTSEEWTSCYDEYDNHLIAQLVRIAYSTKSIPFYCKCIGLAVAAINALNDQEQRTTLWTINKSGEDLCHMAALRGIQPLVSCLLAIKQQYVSSENYKRYLTNEQKGRSLASKALLGNQRIATCLSHDFLMQERKKLKTYITNLFAAENLPLPELNQRKHRTANEQVSEPVTLYAYHDHHYNCCIYLGPDLLIMFKDKNNRLRKSQFSWFYDENQGCYTYREEGNIIVLYRMPPGCDITIEREALIPLIQ